MLNQIDAFALADADVLRDLNYTKYNKQELKYINITQNTHTQIHKDLLFSSIKIKIQLNSNFCCCNIF